MGDAQYKKCTAVVNLGSQTYVALSRVRSLNGLRLDELHYGKLRNENTAITDALGDGKIANFSKIQ
jgi:hypothetical protein